MIELGKQYQTRDGRAVRILCVDGPVPMRPVTGFIEGCTSVLMWGIDGYASTIGPAQDWDLFPVPTKHEGWMAISNKTGLPLADARRGVWLDRSDAIAFCNQADEHVILVTWFS